MTSAVALPGTVRRKISLYLAGLVLLLALGAPYGGLIDIPISFLLKNRLNMTATEVAHFRLLCSVPLYFACVFGFIRDSWSPFAMGDRGHMVIFGVASAVVYAAFAALDVTPVTLTVAVLLSTTTFLFVISAQSGLTAALGRSHVMSGQLSTVWNIFLALPTLGAFWLGGVLSGWLEQQPIHRAGGLLFLSGAVIMAATALYALWRPSAVYDNVGARPPSSVRHNLRRLVRHRPIYPALLIWFLWNFAPGSVTPLQYYLQNTLGASDAQWGVWNAVFAGSFIPTYALFGLLSRRWPLKRLLLWGTVAAVPQMIPLVFIHTAAGAMGAAAAIGLMGGVATAAYLDLLIRSSPPGLEGTTLMMSWGLYFIASRFGDVLGAHIYEATRNFDGCVIAITVVYALILPVLRLVPKDLVATRDGQLAAFATEGMDA